MTCFHPSLPPVGGAYPAAVKPCILGSLVAADGVYSTLYISSHYLLRKLCRRPTFSPPLATACMLHCKCAAAAIKCQGVFCRSRAMHHRKVSLNSSLYISVSSWEMGRTARNPLTSQACYSFRLTFFKTFYFRALIPTSFLSTLLYRLNSRPSLT